MRTIQGHIIDRWLACIDPRAQSPRLSTPNQTGHSRELEVGRSRRDGAGRGDLSDADVCGAGGWGYVDTELETQVK